MSHLRQEDSVEIKQLIFVSACEYLLQESYLFLLREVLLAPSALLSSRNA